MRAQLNITQSRSNLVRRLFIVCLAVAAISTSSFSTVTQAAVPPGSGSVTISLQSFDVMHLGGNNWYADGVVQAQNPSAVTIQFSQASNQSMTPNSGGYFAINFTALAGQTLVLDATDSTGTVHAERPLINYEL